MPDVITQQQMQDASVDAGTIATVANGDETTTVVPRLGGNPIRSLRRLFADILAAPPFGWLAAIHAAGLSFNNKGDPGGNVMAIGLFTTASALSVPLGTDTVRTSGYSFNGLGIAQYTVDPAVDAAFVAANPRTSFMTQNGRGFRLVVDGGVRVTQCGAFGDGNTNDTDAFNAAIATGRRVFVPYTPLGYAVSGIKVVESMQIVGEKNGMALAPKLIVNQSHTAAFFNSVGDSVFHCVFENLACTVAPGITDANFYAQSTQTKYSAYFTFRNIETYLGLKASYVGLFIFALWDRCRDGYLGVASDSEHTAIIALAGSYGQTNQQNVNRITDSVLFGAFGGQGAIVSSYGVLWTIDNTDFEALRTRAFVAYNLMQVRFGNCWFEDIQAASILLLTVYPGTAASSSALVEGCNVVFNGPTPVPEFATVAAPGTVAFRRNLFNLVQANTKLCNDGTRVTINEDNLAISGPGAAHYFDGTHHDTYAGGRRMLNGMVDNAVANMNLQNSGGVVGLLGFMSGSNIQVGTDFVTVATSQTGLGGTAVISGYVAGSGAQFRFVKDWQSGVVTDVSPPKNTTGANITFQESGNDLQMKVDAGSLVVFTSIFH